MSVAGGFALTGAVFTLALIVWSMWVADESRGYDYRKWHRPLAGLLGVIAAVLYIAAIWLWVLT